MKEKRYSEEQIIYALEAVDGGQKAVHVCRELGMGQEPERPSVTAKRAPRERFSRRGREGDGERVSSSSRALGLPQKLSSAPAKGLLCPKT